MKNKTKKKAIHILLNIILILSVFACKSCSAEDEIVLPVFKGIDVNENTIFLQNLRDNDHKIHAVDTLNNKVIYTYNFKENIIYNMFYDDKLSEDIFIELNMRVYRLETSTGKLIKLDIPYNIKTFSIVDNSIWFAPNRPGFKGVPIDYFTYDIIEKNGRRVTIPEGITGNGCSIAMKFDNKTYIPMYFSENESAFVFNVTDSRIVEFYEEKMYDLFHFVGNNYLYAYKWNDGNKRSDVYHVKSFEPLETELAVEYSGGSLIVLGMRVFEDGDYVYFFDQVDGVDITKRKKSDYTIVKKITIEDYQPAELAYFKNDHFWVVSKIHKGAYKIDKDLNYTVVK